LNEMFLNRWIEQGRHIEFQPRSSDLTLLDFFLWGYLKNKVYTEECITTNDLKQKKQLSVEMLQRVEGSFRDRENHCTHAEGHPFVKC
ncbi:hypothetical protein WH47_05909, partial [Habropoda laboriosa]